MITKCEKCGAKFNVEVIIECPLCKLGETPKHRRPQERKDSGMRHKMNKTAENIDY